LITKNMGLKCKTALQLCSNWSDLNRTVRTTADFHAHIGGPTARADLLRILRTSRCNESIIPNHLLAIEESADDHPSFKCRQVISLPEGVFCDRRRHSYVHWATRSEDDTNGAHPELDRCQFAPGRLLRPDRERILFLGFDREFVIT
jgi:hypothetical protein